MTVRAAPPDLIAEIAARYGATVAPGATVQRCATGASSRPYPVWDGQKNALVVPDWKERREAEKRAKGRQVAAARRRAVARKEGARQVLQKVLDLHAAGATNAAIAAACEISEGYCRAILSRSGLVAHRDLAHQQRAAERRQDARVAAGRAKAAERDALILALVAKGADIDAIAQATGLRNGQHLRRILARVAPDYAAGFSWPAKGKPQVLPRGPSRAEVQAGRIRALLAEGAGVDRIGAELGIGNRRHLRRVIRRAVPDFGAAPNYLTDLAERDRLVVSLYPSLSRPAMAERLGLTEAQITVAIKRARAAGLLPSVAEAPPPKREKRRPKGLVYQAERKARILGLHRQGKTIEAIMADTGLNRDPVARVLWAAGESVRNERSNLSARRTSELPALIAQGMDGQAIAAHWGVALATVYQIAHRAQVSLTGRANPPNRAQVSPQVAARREKVRSMVLRGVRQVDMIAALGISHATLSTDIKALGLSGASLNIRRRAGDVERKAA